LVVSMPVRCEWWGRLVAEGLVGSAVAVVVS
jgi:hypothetical protein